MIPSHIPANIDYLALIAELNSWGIRDYKIESICGLAEGRIAKFKCGAQRSMIYENASRIYNFWVDEALSRASRETMELASSLQALAATTS